MSTSDKIQQISSTKRRKRMCHTYWFLVSAYCINNQQSAGARLKPRMYGNKGPKTKQLQGKIIKRQEIRAPDQHMSCSIKREDVSCFAVVRSIPMCFVPMCSVIICAMDAMKPIIESGKTKLHATVFKAFDAMAKLRFITDPIEA